MQRRFYDIGDSLSPNKIVELQSNVFKVGVYNGFDLSFVEGTSISISSGFLVFPSGKALLVTNNQTINLSPYDPSTLPVTFTIYYTHEDSGLSGGDPALLKVTIADPIESNYVILGKVFKTSSSISSEDIKTVRKVDFISPASDVILPPYNAVYKPKKVFTGATLNVRNLYEGRPFVFGYTYPADDTLLTANEPIGACIYLDDMYSTTDSTATYSQFLKLFRLNSIGNLNEFTLFSVPIPAKGVVPSKIDIYIDAPINPSMICRCHLIDPTNKVEMGVVNMSDSNHLILGSCLGQTHYHRNIYKGRYCVIVDSGGWEVEHVPILSYDYSSNTVEAGFSGIYPSTCTYIIMPGGDYTGYGGQDYPLLFSVDSGTDYYTYIPHPVTYRDIVFDSNLGNWYLVFAISVPTSVLEIKFAEIKIYYEENI